MEDRENVYWSSRDYDGWTLYAAATGHGVCCITLPNESFDVLTKFVKRHIPNANLKRDDDRLHLCLTQLNEYLNAKRSKFTLPLDLRGTPFQVSVWETLLEIPHGQYLTYSDVAVRIGKPSSVRAVGAANGANPIPFVVPCHRVIGKNGNLTGFRGGVDVKARLLKMEGVKTPG